MIPGTVPALLADLQHAHDLYLDAMGSEIARLEKVARALGAADLVHDDIKAMRRTRAQQERNLRALEQMHRLAAA